MKNYILKLMDASFDQVNLVGGKNASLGEMLQNLDQLGIQIPSGFIVTVDAYYQFITYNQLDNKINKLVKELDVDNLNELTKYGSLIRSWISNGMFPEEMELQILSAYNDLCSLYKQDNVDVAVRSSATVEDLPDASFAGQQDRALNMTGPDALLKAIKNCFASLFNDRAIHYRKLFNYNHLVIGLSVCVQKMVRSDLGVSGVAFSLDTESGFKDVVLISKLRQ